MINFNSADPKYMLKLGLVRFGLARFKSLWTLRICLVQRYKKGIEPSPWMSDYVRLCQTVLDCTVLY